MSLNIAIHPGARPFAAALVREETRYMTLRQIAVLGVIAANPGIDHKRVSDALSLGHNNLTKEVDHLESAGFVTRNQDQDDRRRRNLQATDAGRRVLREIEVRA
jgi:hypothetical protein